MDKSGNVPVRHWDASDMDFGAYEQGGYVKVRARVETYQTKLQMVVLKVAKVGPEAVNAADFLPASVRPEKEMAQEFEALLASFKDKDYKRLLDSM